LKDGLGGWAVAYQMLHRRWTGSGWAAGRPDFSPQLSDVYAEFMRRARLFTWQPCNVNLFSPFGKILAPL